MNIYERKDETMKEFLGWLSTKTLKRVWAASIQDVPKDRANMYAAERIDLIFADRKSAPAMYTRRAEFISEYHGTGLEFEEDDFDFLSRLSEKTLVITHDELVQDAIDVARLNGNPKEQDEMAAYIPHILFQRYPDRHPDPSRSY
jgi:hypothetical protein